MSNTPVSYLRTIPLTVFDEAENTTEIELPPGSMSSLFQRDGYTEINLRSGETIRVKETMNETIRRSEQASFVINTEHTLEAHDAYLHKLGRTMRDPPDSIEFLEKHVTRLYGLFLLLSAVMALNAVFSAGTIRTPAKPVKPQQPQKKHQEPIQQETREIDNFLDSAVRLLFPFGDNSESSRNLAGYGEKPSGGYCWQYLQFFGTGLFCGSCLTIGGLLAFQELSRRCILPCLQSNCPPVLKTEFLESVFRPIFASSHLGVRVLFGNNHSIPFGGSVFLDGKGGAL